MVAVSVVSYEAHPMDFLSDIKVRFDVTGDGAADWYLQMGGDAVGTDNAWWCSRDRWSLRYPIRVSGKHMTCRFPKRDLHATKPVRFFVFSRDFSVIRDRAPDNGWAS